MDCFCNHNADQLGSLAGLSLLTVYVSVVECASASLSPAPCSFRIAFSHSVPPVPAHPLFISLTVLMIVLLLFLQKQSLGYSIVYRIIYFLYCHWHVKLNFMAFDQNPDDAYVILKLVNLRLPLIDSRPLFFFGILKETKSPD
jgi:hypothetical protein